MKVPVSMHKKVGEHRYRETYGLYFEDFEPGDIFEHRPGRTLTDFDMIAATLLSMNTHPLHFDYEYARKSEFGQCLVPSPLTLSIVVGMSVHSTSQKAVANLEFTDIKFTKPVFVGDTLYAESEIASKRVSKSRAGTGLVSVITRGFKVGREGDGELIEFMKYRRTFLVPHRGHGIEEEANY